MVKSYFQYSVRLKHNDSKENSNIEQCPVSTTKLKQKAEERSYSEELEKKKYNEEDKRQEGGYHRTSTRGGVDGVLTAALPTLLLQQKKQIDKQEAQIPSARKLVYG